jgi:hypothetical protein
MSRHRNEVPTDRFNVSLPRPIANKVKALAEAQRTSGPAAIAALLTSAIQSDADDQDADEARILASAPYQRLMAEKDRLAEALTEARRRLAEQHRASSDEMETRPRWAWPLDCLLADAEWWERWLPRLYQLLGSEGAVRDRIPLRAGYVDLLEHLFPAIDGVTWRSPDYRTAAEECVSSAPRSSLPNNPGRAQAWEPVLRHVVRALAALETTEESGADPFHAMRVHDEISGPWVAVLRHLLGRSLPELHDLPRWEAR